MRDIFLTLSDRIFCGDKQEKKGIDNNEKFTLAYFLNFETTKDIRKKKMKEMSEEEINRLKEKIWKSKLGEVVSAVIPRAKEGIEIIISERDIFRFLVNCSSDFSEEEKDKIHSLVCKVKLGDFYLL